MGGLRPDLNFLPRSHAGRRREAGRLPEPPAQLPDRRAGALGQGPHDPRPSDNLDGTLKGSRAPRDGLARAKLTLPPRDRRLISWRRIYLDDAVGAPRVV